MPTYNKLVRDRIPEIIRANGNKFNTEILDEAEYKKELQLKLKEELQEYLEAQEDSHAVEELADMLELIYSLVEVHHSSIEEVEEVRREKREIRGGFDERVYLIDVEDQIGINEINRSIITLMVLTDKPMSVLIVV